jgi:prepilin-type processing-associated H-X9-DG protein
VRAERFKLLLERYGCPGQPRTCARYREGPPPPDAALCDELGPYRAVSYLMSAHFQFVGQQDKFRVVGTIEHPTEPQPITARAADPEWEVRVDRFLPRLTTVGPPARKVFAADGTRYLEQQDDREPELDVDLHPAPRVFGAFSCAGGWWAGSTAWGVDGNTLNWDGTPVGAESPSHGQNLPLSYRHGSRSGAPRGSARDNPGFLNAAYFDGHVDRLRDRPSRAAHLWYPSGAIVRIPSEGMTNLPQGFIIP